MNINFYKYSGLGNDFILLDVHGIEENMSNLNKKFWKSVSMKLCDRRYGVGADGLILFRTFGGSPSFEMVNINPDGSFSAMCGNATRCAAQHFFQTYPKFEKTPFIYWQPRKGIPMLKICESQKLKKDKVSVCFDLKSTLKGPYKVFHTTWYYFNSGTDHIVTYVSSLSKLSTTRVGEIGRKIRSHPLFKPNGANVNFVFHDRGNKFYIRTFEKGVEAETLACATGSAAAVIVKMILSNSKTKNAEVIQPSGESLHIQCDRKNPSNITLEQSGRASLIFTGIYDLQL